MLLLSSYNSGDSLTAIIWIVVFFAAFFLLPRINWSFLYKKEHRAEYERTRDEKLLEINKRKNINNESEKMENKKPKKSIFSDFETEKGGCLLLFLKFLLYVGLFALVMWLIETYIPGGVGTIITIALVAFLAFVFVSEFRN